MAFARRYTKTMNALTAAQVGAATEGAPSAAAAAASASPATQSQGARAIAKALADAASASRAPLGETPEDRRRRVEALVAEHAREFELTALVDQLAHLGYRREEVVYGSYLSTATQQGAVQFVEFRTQPMRMAVVTLNIGLLSPQSPLPSYFLRILESGDVDDAAFQAFLGYFDHVILQSFLEAAYPETSPQIYKSWETTKRNYLSLLGLRSLSTHHWLFQIIFPELGVTVDRGTMTRSVRVEPARLGSIELGGSAALGGLSKVPVPGFDVNLYADEEMTPQNRPWAEEVRKRLRAIIFPILREADLDMKISLTIRSQRGWVRLGPGNYLGFDRLKGGSQQNRVIVIHKGTIPAE